MMYLFNLLTGCWLTFEKLLRAELWGGLPGQVTVGLTLASVAGLPRWGPITAGRGWLYGLWCGKISGSVVNCTHAVASLLIRVRFFQMQSSTLTRYTECPAESVPIAAYIQLSSWTPIVRPTLLCFQGKNNCFYITEFWCELNTVCRELLLFLHITQQRMILSRVVTSRSVAITYRPMRGVHLWHRVIPNILH